MKTSRKRRRILLVLSGFLRLVRWPNLIIIVLTQYLAAVFLAHDVHDMLAVLTDVRFFLLCLSTVIIAAAGYIINDYYDVKIDYINKPHRVVVGRILRRRIVIMAHFAMNIIAIAIGTMLSWKIGVLYVVTIFLLWWYSNYLKRLPLVGNIIIALLTGLSIFVIALFYKNNEFLISTYAVFAFSITLIREIIKDMEDLKGDSTFGCKTLPIIWGIRKTKYLLYLLIALFVFLLFLMSLAIKNYILFMYFMILILPVAYFVYRLVNADTKREFGYLSNYCKVLMLSGILSMIFF